MGDRWPDVFIVGAPRTGTTFLWEALRHHPSVFMSSPKEPLYFCSDLNTGTEADRHSFLTDKDRYLGLFRAAPRDALVGEACVFNLLSAVAAERIRAVRPDARIIVSLREPVAQMVSFHSVRVSEGHEDLPFAEALAAESDRLRGKRLPPHAVLVPAYAYRSVASYADQVERYLLSFPRDQLLVLFYEDLQRDRAAWLDRVRSFLGLEREIRRERVDAPQFKPRSNGLSNLIRSPSVIRAAKRSVPQRVHPHARRAVEAIGRLNRRRAPTATVDADLRQRVRAELEPDVDRLGKMLDEDLVARWG